MDAEGIAHMFERARVQAMAHILTGGGMKAFLKSFPFEATIKTVTPNQDVHSMISRSVSSINRSEVPMPARPADIDASTLRNQRRLVMNASMCRMLEAKVRAAAIPRLMR